MNGFEGSFLGQSDRIEASTTLECGVCWSVYDPAVGDPVWQIPPGTAFSDLPAHWRCPHCDAPQEQFMVLARGADIEDSGLTVRSQRAAESLHGRLLSAYEQVAERMRSLPVFRDDLPVGVLGPQPCAAGRVALVYTPWSMLIVLLADDADRLVEGSERNVELPSGTYPFVRGHLDGLGPVENCSLFSPMEDFEDSAAVVAVARAAFEGLLKDDDENPAEASQAALHASAAEQELDSPSRRSFLTGGAAGP